MAKRRNYKDLGEFTMPPELVEKVERMTAEADAEIEAARVNFRWGKPQLDIVKLAAQNMGVPYQTLIKLVVYQHALSILKDVEAVKKKNKVA
jgi:predicted DNA binding CopG/RHH family protein